MSSITVNGREYSLEGVDGGKTLLRYLREDLGLTGTKNGCGIGACGACTVLLDKNPVRSCVTPLKKAAGREVITIEGMESSGGELHPVQQAFIDAGAVQCGFCTPGMVLTSYALLLQNPKPDRGEIRRALKNNLCRCTGYQQIVDAVELSAERMGSGGGNGASTGTRVPTAGERKR
jgi:carbon-monoxide dehydrogenase small subunit